jgi:protein TonB
VTPPSKIRDAAPQYPPIALSARVQGDVIIEATIGADGKVKDARVLRSVPLLDEAAIAAVRSWEYTPTLVSGQAVPIIMTVTVRFRLQ